MSEAVYRTVTYNDNLALLELILLTQVLELVTLDNLTFIFKKAKVWRFD